MGSPEFTIRRCFPNAQGKPRHGTRNFSTAHRTTRSQAGSLRIALPDATKPQVMGTFVYRVCAGLLIALALLPAQPRPQQQVPIASEGEAKQLVKLALESSGMSRLPDLRIDRGVCSPAAAKDYYCFEVTYTTTRSQRTSSFLTWTGPQATFGLISCANITPHARSANFKIECASAPGSRHNTIASC